jgi:hypothetical protein
VTWGQLRLQLQIYGPGVAPDLLDEFLNGRYEQVLEATDWSGLQYHATIQTTAAYQSASDTVTLTVGSPTVAGAGTAWTAAITGLQFYRPGDTAAYTATLVSATALTLDRPYEGNAAVDPRGRDGQRNPGARRAQQKSFQWRNRLSSTAHSYWDELAADRQQQRRREDRERRGEIAFRFPIFWTCWKSQCRLAYHKS